MPLRPRVQISGGAPVGGSGGGYAFRSQEGTLGYWSTEAPDDFDFTGDSEGFWPVSRLRQGYIDYLTAKSLEYEEQKQARHYYHGAQWTPEEIRRLRDRRQPVITFNRISRKVDSLVGLTQRMRQDPKAYPRNPKNADGAEIATQCVRSVLDGNDWDFIDPYCAGQAAIEGIGGVELRLIDGDHQDPDIGIDYVFGDDFFYDPRSYKPDFSDARYMGIAKWLDVEAAIELFPDKEVELRTLMVETGFDLTTHSDREFKWIYVNEKRLRLVEQWYKHDGRWYWAFYCSLILLDQGVSPFLDERGKPMNRYIMFSASVDHDGDRYGLTRNLKGPQDELNQRRSKALFMSNVTRLIGQKGAVDDVEKARREYARPDGYVEYNPSFQPPTPDDKSADLAQQLALMQDARGEIDSFANILPDSLRMDEPTEHSGVAINYLQKAGLAELGSFFRNYRNWKKRVYRAVWNIAQRVWVNERWIRITDNDGLQQFIQLNGSGLNEYGQPVLINYVGNLSVEMTMDEGPDEASLEQDAYDVLKNYPPGTIPPQVLIELSPLSSSKKKQVLQALQPPPPDPVTEQAKQASLDQMRAKTQESAALAERHRSQSVSDAARAAHLMSQAGLNAQQGYMQATQGAQAPGGQSPDIGGPPSQPGAPPSASPPSPQGAPMGGPPSPPAPTGFTVPPTHPILGQARRARDGRHYVPDPSRPGKYLMVR